ncbi:MAG: hypothetical protein EBZ51_07595 [Synechococcaceae bacterium WB9_2_112]|nr:hypothetical protein [Synechococcaceae bacterium WB9_2_112]
MTTEDQRHLSGTQPDPGADEGLMHGQPLPAQTDHDYRQLEQHYRRSAQYAAMVARYPQLRHWISHCSNVDLVGDPAETPIGHAVGGVVLQWDRSHGES